MNVSAGFVTLALCGFLGVVLPAIASLCWSWRQGRTGRVLAVLGGLLSMTIVIPMPIPMEPPDEITAEETVLARLLIWGLLLYGSWGLFFAFHMLKHATRFMLFKCCRPTHRG